MLGRIIFFVVLAAAILAVVLLATVSLVPGRSHGESPPAPALRALTVYIHPASPEGTVQQQQQQRRQGEPRHQQAASALVFRHRVTAGPEITSRTVGAASGFAFLLPTGDRRGPAMSVFGTVHLAFIDAAAAGLSGSLCVEAAAASGKKSEKAAQRPGPGEELLRVVGGTGTFAFARGHGVLRRAVGRGTTALRLDLSVATTAAE